VGYAWDRTLFYVKGGAAFVQLEASVADACQTVAAGCGNWIITTRDTTNTITTWTLGGGVEWAIYNNWSIKGEYMFIGSGDGFTTCGFAAAPGGVAVSGGQFCFNHEFPGSA
jgi:outer membrane immunogenic protein